MISDAVATIIHTLYARGAEHPDRTALRYKEADAWRDVSWAWYVREVERLGAALLALGIEPGDRVAILSTNRREWLYADLAAMAVGAASVPVYPTSPPHQAAYVLGHCGAKVVFCGDGEQVAKVRSVWGELPALAHVVAMPGTPPVGDPRVLAWEDLVGRGEAAGEEGRAAVRARTDALEPRSLATVVYTSGTTGPPKGAMLSHGNLAVEAAAIARIFDAGEDDATLSFLPLSHIAERLQGELVAIAIGYTVNFAESMEKVLDNLQEVQPTILLCVPRLWEKIYARLQDGLASAPPMRRRIFAWAGAVGLEWFAATHHGEKPGAWLSVQHALAGRLVYSKLRARLGMTRTRRLVSGAAPLSKELAEFFASLGLVITEAYGQTECVGVSHFNPPDRVRFGTVGVTLPGVEARLAEDGEILVRGGNVFMGYLADAKATAETVVGGWLHTGDVGELTPEGYLRITDRKKDIIVTAAGKNIAPQDIENRLKNHVGISQAVVIGDQRPYVVALITLDVPTLQSLWAREGRGELPEASAPRDPAVRTLLQGYVDQVNAGLGRWEQIKYFAVLDRDFTVEDDELTPSLKVRRRVIQKRYAEVVDGLYARAPAG
ncbi:long-chain fatty acid--CoA ligase [Myxococcota bacterium]|nr:long-chain fatty acid--CoA ligase [Myxococcota bacterium]